MTLLEFIDKHAEGLGPLVFFVMMLAFVAFVMRKL